jgi:hypothetical protein
MSRMIGLVGIAVLAGGCASTGDQIEGGNTQYCMSEAMASDAFASGAMHRVIHRAFGPGLDLQTREPDTPLTGFLVQYGGRDGWISCNYFNREGLVFSSAYLGFSVAPALRCPDEECELPDRWHRGEFGSLPSVPTGAWEVDWSCAYRDEEGVLRPSIKCGFR